MWEAKISDPDMWQTDVCSKPKDVESFVKVCIGINVEAKCTQAILCHKMVIYDISTQEGSGLAPMHLLINLANRHFSISTLPYSL